MGGISFGKMTGSFALVAVLASATPLAAEQQPRFVHAKIETRSAQAGLEPPFRSLVAAQAAPAWIGYAVPAAGSGNHMCCYSGAWHGGIPYGRGCCKLEGKDEGTDMRTEEERQNDAQKPTVALEENGAIFVLFRAVHGKVERIRMFSQDCELDAGGRTVYWLTGVRGAESVALLSGYVTHERWPATKHDDDADDADDDDGESLGQGGIAAIAEHADPAADEALERFVAPAQPESLRKQAAFWMGVARGQRGYEALRRIVREDPSESVREQAVFALSQSKVPAAVDAMIATARNDRSAHVRGQALFWLAQRAGRKASEAITSAIESDPETDVKKKAVFALSQLPPDQGVPLLIQVARSNRNPAVRKQAIFWLGQSNDPRALNYIAEVLK